MQPIAFIKTIARLEIHVFWVHHLFWSARTISKVTPTNYKILQK